MRQPIAYAQIRWLRPFPRNLGNVFTRFKRILVPEINLGQLVRVLRSEFLLPLIQFNKVRGLPLKSSEIEEKIEEVLVEGLEHLS